MYIEDYLMLLNGHMCEHCHRRSVFKLASYDYGPVRSMCTAYTLNRGLSDKQQELARVLVKKYARQFRKHGIDVTDDCEFQLPVREVDRTRTVGIRGDQIIIKFPFVASIVNYLRGTDIVVSETITEKAIWFADVREWRIQLTEQTAVFALALANDNNGFVVDKTLVRIVDEVEQSRTKTITADLDNVGQVVLRNAPAAAQTHFSSNSANLTFIEQMHLVKSMGIYAYTSAVRDRLSYLSPDGNLDSMFSHRTLVASAKQTDITDQALFKLAVDGLLDLGVKRIAVYAQTTVINPKTVVDDSWLYTPEYKDKISISDSVSLLDDFNNPDTVPYDAVICTSSFHGPIVYRNMQNQIPTIVQLASSHTGDEDTGSLIF